MRRRIAALMLVCLVGVLVAAEPEPAPKAGERWEYAELYYSSAATKGRGQAGGPGGAGGVGGPGGAGGVVMPKRLASSVRWVTEAGDLEAANWDDLATKLKMPAVKDATAAALKVKVLNHLGRQGWELVSSTTTVMTFKRRVVK